jgi:glycosyltransferase involved in cell wall biosynthesis
MKKTPTVSVVMPAYNHVSFVAEAVNSVLGQDFSDLELLVGDDGSKDGTADMVRSIHDSRITLFDHGVNRGAAVVHNELVSRATGKYVAVINSDDAWMPGKLSAQVAYLEEHPEVVACFAKAQFIDRDGAEIPKKNLSFGNVFDVENRSRGAWLRFFLTRGNCLCHPTLLIRREAYQNLGTYDNRLLQLPDFDMWVRLVKRYQLTILDSELIRFRVMPGENASSDTSTNQIRVLNEHYFIARTFFDGVSAELLDEGFSDLLTKKIFASEGHLEIEKAFLLLTDVPTLGPMYKQLALASLHNLLAIGPYREMLIADYGFDDRALQSLATEVTVFRQASPVSALTAAPTKFLAEELSRRLRHWAKRYAVRFVRPKLQHSASS